MFNPGCVPRAVDSLFSLDGWTDAKPLLAEESKKIKPWTFLIHPDFTEDAVLSAPEAFDPKTDAGCLENIPLKELITRKTIVPASSLSETEIVDLFDALLIYQSMFMKSEHITATLFTCTYLHDLSLVEGNPTVKAMIRAVLKSIDIIVNAVTSADVRDSDEEFVPFTYDIECLSEESVKSILDELDAAIKTAPDALKSRLNVQRALLGATDGFASINAYAPTEAPLVAQKRDEFLKKRAEKAEEKKKKAEEKAAAAASSSGNKDKKNKNKDEKQNDDEDKKEDEDEDEEEEQIPPTSLLVYSKEELDAIRPAGIDLAALTKAFHSAVGAWHRTTEPAKTEKVFCKFAPLWLSNASPIKQPELTPFATAKQFYKELSSNFNALLQLKQQKVFNNWYLLLNAIKNFTASGAGIVARSVGLLFLYNPRVDLILDSKSFPECILHTIDVIHGQPLYNHIYFEHDSVLSALLQSKVEDALKAAPAALKKNPTQMKQVAESMKNEIVGTTRDVVGDVARTCFQYIHTLLRAKGGAHRRMYGSVIPAIVQVSGTVQQIESVMFGVRPENPRQQSAMQQDPKVTRHFCLYGFTQEVLHDAIDTQFNMEVTLDLISKPETVCFQLYRFLNMQKRLSNAEVLFVEQSALVSAATGASKNKNSMKSLIDANGAAAAYRQSKPAPIATLRSWDAAKTSANVAFMILSALGPNAAKNSSGVIPDLNQGELSLVSTETVFERRFANLRAVTGSSPEGTFFMSYKEMLNQQAKLPSSAECLGRTNSMLEPFLANLKKHIEVKSGANQPLPATVSFDTVAKHNVAVFKTVLGLVHGAGSKNLNDALGEWKFDFENVSGFPQFIRFNLTTKSA